MRDKSDMSYVYSLEVAVPDEHEVWSNAGRPHAVGSSPKLYREPPFEMPRGGRRPLDERPVIVGSGPAGVFAAYFLAEQGYRPLVLERGRRVRERIADMRAFDAGGPHDPESNYLFGEGGAGTFSDGKLTCRSIGPRRAPRARSCSPSARASRRSSTTIARTWAATACRPWSRRCGSGSSRWAASSASTAGSRTWTWPTARCAAWSTSSGYLPASRRRAGHRPQRPRHLRDAAPPRRADGAQAVSDRRAHRAAAGAGQSRAVRRRAAGRQAGRGRLHAGRPRPDQPVHVLHVRRRLRHAQRFRAGALLHQRHEPVASAIPRSPTAA